MALPDLEDHLASHGVDPALSSHMVQNGWTSQNFAMIVDSKEAFTEDVWSELSDAPIPLVFEGCLAAFAIGGCAFIA